MKNVQTHNHFRDKYLRRAMAIMIACICMILSVQMDVKAQGTTFSELDDIYFTKGNVTVYQGPDYTSMVLTVIGDNMPVHVIGKYSNGWYRINIGVVGYVKMDSLTTAWDRSTTVNTSTQAGAALATANEIGYAFHNMVLNEQKTIKKDVFNSYIDEKAILFAAADDQVAVSFKMLYPDKIKNDIELKFTKTCIDLPTGGQSIELFAPTDAALYGQVAIWQIRVGYDKSADIYIWDMDDGVYELQSTVYSEDSEYIYFATTQVSSMKIEHTETERSLTEKLREKRANIRKGIKYLKYDRSSYRNMISNRLRKDTEYVDYYDSIS